MGEEIEDLYYEHKFHKGNCKLYKDRCSTCFTELKNRKKVDYHLSWSENRKIKDDKLLDNLYGHYEAY